MTHTTQPTQDRAAMPNLIERLETRLLPIALPGRPRAFGLPPSMSAEENVRVIPHDSLTDPTRELYEVSWKISSRTSVDRKISCHPAVVKEVLDDCRARLARALLADVLQLTDLAAAGILSGTQDGIEEALSALNHIRDLAKP
jgi:hypothetical protein